MYTGRSETISSNSCRVEMMLYLIPRPSTHSEVLFCLAKVCKTSRTSSFVLALYSCAAPIQMEPHNKWKCESINPGVTVQIFPSITRVDSSWNAFAPSFVPTNMMRLPFIATASARGFASSLVKMRALLMMKSDLVRMSSPLCKIFPLAMRIYIRMEGRSRLGIRRVRDLASQRISGLAGLRFAV